MLDLVTNLVSSFLIIPWKHHVFQTVDIIMKSKRSLGGVFNSTVKLAKSLLEDTTKCHWLSRAEWRPPLQLHLLPL